MGEGLVSRDSDKAPCVFETYDDIESEAGARFIQATADKAGERLDVFAARASGETRAFMQRLIGTGSVCVNGEERRANARLRLGDSVEIRIEAPAQTALIPEDIPLSIVYQDADIAVIDKPKGMVVHPAPGNERGTLHFVPHPGSFRHWRRAAPRNCAQDRQDDLWLDRDCKK